MRMTGYIEGVFGREVRGWIADQDDRAATFSVRVFVNGLDIGVATGDILREDIKRSGFGTGIYGFAAPLPDWVGDLPELEIAAGEVSTGWPLIGSHVHYLKLFDGRYAKDLVHADSDTVMFLTTPISGTGSAIRILDAMCAGAYRFQRYTDDFYHRGALEELRRDVPPAKGHVLAHNVPECFNNDLDVSKYRWIVNMRDPRDLLCNQFHWVFSHPRPELSEAEIEEFRERFRAQGIDQSVLNSKIMIQYDQVLKTVARIPRDRLILRTYASLCMNFDAYVQGMADFLDIKLRPEQLQVIENERAEHLKDNPKWIGNEWPGADAMPGRYLEELRPETILELNRRYSGVLDFLRENDDPAVASTYDVQINAAEVEATRRRRRLAQRDRRPVALPGDKPRRMAGGALVVPV